jgi:putative DNA primase/helicase
MSAVIDERSRAEQALSFIPADIERERWWKVGAALKHEFGEPGFDVFDGWSRTAKSYIETDVRDTWKSLKNDGGITISTLYALAKEYGFDPRQHRGAMDPAELERRRTDREARAAREEEKTQKTAKHAATLARAVWSKAKPARDDHPYLIRKGLTAVDALREIDADKLPALLGYSPLSSGQLLAGRILIVPVKIGASVSTVEMIDETGLKSALAGGAKSGGYWAASAPDKSSARILVAEGVATALSAHRCTGLPAIAALSCGNLKRVAEAMRNQYPEASITVLADIGNGQEYAFKAARAVGGALASPDFGDDRPPDATDFNDMHGRLGADAVRRTIDAASRVDVESDSSESPAAPVGFPTLEERPCYRVYEDWQEVDGRKMKPGVYLHTTKAERTDAPPSLIDKWISTPLRVLATTSNGEDAEYGRLLEIRSPAGKWKPWAMPMAMLAGDGSDALGVLMSEGLIPYFNDKKAVLRYIAEQVPNARMRAASVTGWSGDAFVLPNTVIGADDIWFQASGRTAPYVSGGTFDQWRGLVALAPGNPLLMLAFSAAFAGPLLGPLNIGGAGANLYGDSSTGKTTAMDAAVSVWGSPAFKRTWRATANGLEGTGSLHSDTLLALDELGEIDPKSLYEAAYALINGTGKTRANRHGEARQASRWRVFLLSTGELTIAARMSAGGIEAKAGQELRILDVPVSGKHGLFDNLHGRASGAAMSDEVRNLAARNYGHAGPRFVAELVIALRNGLNLANELQPLLERFGVEGQERRAARTFAICGLAGELAVRWNIVPWKAGSATKAAMHAFELWRRRRGANEHGVEHAAILRSLADFIDRHADSRFSNIEGSSDLIRERAGYWRQDSDRRLYLFTSGGLREATRGYDLMRVLAALDKAKALAATDLDKRSKKTRDPTGRAVSLYHIDPDALTGDE